MANGGSSTAQCPCARNNRKLSAPAESFNNIYYRYLLHSARSHTHSCSHLENNVWLFILLIVWPSQEWEWEGGAREKWCIRHAKMENPMLCGRWHAAWERVQTEKGCLLCLYIIYKHVLAFYCRKIYTHIRYARVFVCKRIGDSVFDWIYVYCSCVLSNKWLMACWLASTAPPLALYISR